MVIRLGHFTFRCSHHFAMIAQKNENRIVKPRLFFRSLHKLPDRPVGIFYNLFFEHITMRVKIGRNHIRGMITDRQQYAEERIPRPGPFIQNRKCILIHEVILHTEAVYYFFRRIILLSVDFVEPVRAKESIHIVVLRFVSHKEQVTVSVLLQYGRQSRIDRNHRTFHGIPFHDSRKRIKRGINTMIGMNTGGVEMTETQGLLIKAVQIGSQFLIRSKSPH